MIYDKDLQEWRRLADAATAEPWAFYSDDDGIAELEDAEKTIIGSAYDSGDWSHANAKFIAAARTAVPVLLDEVAFQRELVATHIATLVSISDALGMSKDDFTLVQDFAGAVAKEREQLRAIVRDLAAVSNPYDYEVMKCLFCDADVNDFGEDPHVESCPWRRARELIGAGGKR